MASSSSSYLSWDSWAYAKANTLRWHGNQSAAVARQPDRRSVFDGDAINRLRMNFAKVCASLDTHLIEIAGADDQVHLLVEHPPKVAI